MANEYEIPTDEFISGGNEGSPDPGRPADALEPLSPDEYEKEKLEAREENSPEE